MATDGLAARTSVNRISNGMIECNPRNNLIENDCVGNAKIILEKKASQPHKINSPHHCDSHVLVVCSMVFAVSFPNNTIFFGKNTSSDSFQLFNNSITFAPYHLLTEISHKIYTTSDITNDNAIKRYCTELIHIQQHHDEKLLSSACTCECFIRI